MKTRAAMTLEAEFSEHAPFLRALARRLASDASAADDLVQETYVAAMAARPRSATGLRPWFATVLRNRAARRVRGDRRRRAREQVVAEAQVSPDPAAVASKIEVGRRLLAHVDALGPDYRAVVFLRYYEGLKPGEIADRLGLAVATVKTRLARATAKLRERLDADDPSGRQKWLPAMCAIGGVEAMRTGATATVAESVVAARRALSLRHAVVGGAAFLLASVAIWVIADQLSGPAVPPRAAAVDQVLGRSSTGVPSSDREAANTPVPVPATVVAGVVEDAGIGADQGSGVPAANVVVRCRLRFAKRAPQPVTGSSPDESVPLVHDGGEDELETTTDAGGRFQIEVPAGAELMRLVAVGDGRVADAGWSRWTSSRLPEPLVLTRYLRSAFAGRVLEPSGLGVAGAKVALVRWEGKRRVLLERFTDGDGHFAFAEVPEECWLQASCPGYVQVCSSMPTAGPRGGWQPGRVVLAKAATLEVEIENAVGAPASCVQGVAVMVAGSESGLSAVAQGPTGRYRGRAKVTAGRARVVVPSGLRLALLAGQDQYLWEHDGQCEPEAVPSADRRAISLAAGEQRALRLVIATDVSVLTTVVDAEGQPVAGADLSFARAMRGMLQPIRAATTDDQGQFELQVNAVARDVCVVARASGTGATAGLRAVLLLHLGGVEPQKLELKLAPEQSLLGTVRDRGGRPVAASIRRVITLPGLADTVRESGSWSTAADGTFQVPGVPGATHRLEISADEFSTEVREGLRLGDAPLDVVMTASRRAMLRLQPGDASAQYLDVGLSYFRGDPSTAPTWPELTGRPNWSHAAPSPGLLDMRVLPPEGPWGAWQNHFLPARGGDIELSLDRGVVWITISGAGGRGEPMARITTGPVRIPEGSLELPVELPKAIPFHGRVLFSDQTDRFDASVALADDRGRLLAMSVNGMSGAWQTTLPTSTYGHFLFGAVPQGTWQLRVGTPEELRRGESRWQQRVLVAGESDEPLLVRL